MRRKGLVISVTAAIIVLVALLAACGESATPTPTPNADSYGHPYACGHPNTYGYSMPDKSDDTGENLQCGIGPIESPETTGEPSQTQFQPRCPTTPSENAQPIFALATCSFGKDEKDCTTVPVPENYLSGIPGGHFNLIDPNPGVPPGCAGELLMSVLSTSNGGAEIRWEGQEKDPQTCNQIGPDLTGSTTLPCPCCQRIVDIHYPEQDFTFRVLVQMDWQD